jgi:hypothetical protein
MGYHLEGVLLEVCTCNVLCPCWIGEDPDFGTCDAILAYHYEKGEIDGVDVSGLTVAMAGHIPGNVLEGNWKVSMFVDERASDEQMAALLSVLQGEKGGPCAELAQLVGEVVSTQKAPITFEVTEGRGTIKVGDTAYAEMEPYRGPTGEVTQLVESIFSTIPGSPAYVSKAEVYKLNEPNLGLNIDLKGHNAIQGTFLFDG